MPSEAGGYPVGNVDPYQRGWFKWAERITQKPFIAQGIPERVLRKVDRRRNKIRREQRRELR